MDAERCPVLSTMVRNHFTNLAVLNGYRQTSPQHKHAARRARGGSEMWICVQICGAQCTL